MTIDERLEAVARDLQMLTRIHMDRDREYQERFEATGNEYRALIKAAEERHEKEMAAIRAEAAATRADLRRAFRLGVQEARRARVERRELRVSVAALDDKITQLAAAQLVTEEKLQRLLEKWHGNGQPPRTAGAIARGHGQPRGA